MKRKLIHFESTQNKYAGQYDNPIRTHIAYRIKLRMVKAKARVSFDEKKPF